MCIFKNVFSVVKDIWNKFVLVLLLLLIYRICGNNRAICLFRAFSKRKSTKLYSQYKHERNIFADKENAKLNTKT